MKGRYRIYDGSSVVAEFDNIITNRGREVIGKFLAGQRASWSDAISIGSGDSSAQATDQFLDMEFWREEVDLRAYNTNNNQIVLRSRIPASVIGKIYELSVHAASSSNRSFSTSPMISSFDTSVESWSGGSDNTDDSRIGNRSLELSPSGTTLSAYWDFEGDLRAYDNETKFRLGYLASGSITSVRLRFKSTDSDYREYSFSPSTSGYQVENWLLQDFSITGSPEWKEIYRLEVAVSGTGTLVFDGLSAIFEKTDDPDSILVSRALVAFNSSSFFKKNAQRELQIEYILDLNI